MRADTTVALLALLCLAAGAAAVLAAPAVASHGGDANFTVQPEERAPNASGATYDMWAVVEEPYENLTMVQYRLDEEAFYDCTADDLREFGIDRGGNDPGLETDEQPPAVYKEFGGSFFRYSVNGSFDLSAGDELVASISNCVYNPEEEGWYQGQIYLTDENDSFRLQTKSHYYWICECENESEARERLGPPPSEISTTQASTPTEEPVVTEKPTQEPSPSEGASTTATSTSTPVDDGAASTQTPTATGTASLEPTATAGADESAPVRSDEDAATPGSGPGFGPLVAVIALAAVALLARRRG